VTRLSSEDEHVPLPGKNIRRFRNGIDYCVGARGSVVVKALCYKPEGRGFDSRFPGVYSASNRNEYQKH
jgi:hypothetical protein